MQFSHLWIWMNSMMIMKMCFPESMLDWGSCCPALIPGAVFAWSLCFHGAATSSEQMCSDPVPNLVSGRLGDSLLANLGRCLAQIFPKLLGTLGYFHPTFSTFSFHDHILIAVHCLPTFARSLLYYLCILTLILWHLCLFILMLSLEGRILPGFTDSKR